MLIHVQHLLGTGHLVRSGAIARAFAKAGHETVLASGGDVVPGFDPGGADFLQLPPVRALDARFSVLAGSDGRPYAAIQPERRDHLLALAADFRPDVLIIEAFPFGRRAFRGEIEPLVTAARASGTRLVASSVRDVLVSKPDPARNAQIEDAVERLFDLVLVHGDRNFLALETSFPVRRIGPRLRYTGYVAESMPAPQPGTARQGVIVSAGGGAVGGPLLQAALQARRLSRLRAEPWRIMTGPNLPDGVAACLAAEAPAGVTVEPNRADFPALLAGSRLSISQAGYNTVLDLIRARTPAVLVPFAGPGETEQALRAERLVDSGLARIVPEASLSPQSIAVAVDAALDMPPKEPSIALDGARRTVEIVESALDGR